MQFISSYNSPGEGPLQVGGQNAGLVLSIIRFVSFAKLPVISRALASWACVHALAIFAAISSAILRRFSSYHPCKLLAIQIAAESPVVYTDGR